MDIRVLGHRDDVALEASRVGHQPQTHLHADTKRALRKDTIVIRTEAVVEQLPTLIWLLFVEWLARVCLGVWQSIWLV